MNMGKIKGDILCNKVYEEPHTLKIEPLILLCESANISIEEFEQRCSPRFEDIVLQENITNWDDFHVSITLHDDPNMLNLDHDEFYPKSRGHCKVNGKNLKAYNRINYFDKNGNDVTDDEIDPNNRPTIEEIMNRYKVEDKTYPYRPKN